ncbi:hypothetical protein KI387_012616, partial [Taxus chinensis]
PKNPVWSEMPMDVIQKIFTHLPVESIYNFRRVSKDFNNLLSSQKFLSALNRSGRAWLLFRDRKERNYVAYSFLTRTFKTISLSFLPQFGNSDFYYESCGRGLLLQHFTRSNAIYVCNPLNRTYSKLGKCSTLGYKRIAGIFDGDDTASYKIILIVDYSSIQVYNSREDSLTTVGYIPDRKGYYQERNLFWKGYLILGMQHAHPDFRAYIIVYTIPDFVSYFSVALPVKSWMRFRLIKCRSSVVGVELSRKEPETITVWEFDQKIPSWKEIGRVPLFFFRGNDDFNLDDCVGVEDYICFFLVEHNHGKKRAIVYDLKQRSWEYLRFNCCLPLTRRRFPSYKPLAFEPMSDIVLSNT